MKVKMQYQIISEYKCVVTVVFFIGGYACHVATGKDDVMYEKLRGFFTS